MIGENPCPRKNVLIGKIITDVKIANDKQALLFITDVGEVKVLCDADCCSTTWVEHIEMPALGLPAKVLQAEDLEMPNLGDMPDCDVVEYYGFKITTDKGELVIDYRNDSNGYYGGSLTWPDERHYGGVFRQNNSDEEWVAITNDI